MNKRRRWKSKRRRRLKRDGIALYWYYRQAADELIALVPKALFFLDEL